MGKRPQDHTKPTGRKKHSRGFNRGIRILLVTNALVLLASAMLGPIYALFVEEIGGDILDAGTAAAMFSIAAGATVLFSGKLADRVKEPELIVVAGYAILAIGNIGMIFVGSMLGLLVVQALIGFGEAFFSPAFDALYSQHSDDEHSGTEWGAWEAMYYFTTAGGAILGGAIAKWLGFDWLFVVMAILCFASALYIRFLPRKVL